MLCESVRACKALSTLNPATQFGVDWEKNKSCRFKYQVYNIALCYYVGIGSSPSHIKCCQAEEKPGFCRGRVGIRVGLHFSTNFFFQQKKMDV